MSLAAVDWLEDIGVFCGLDRSTQSLVHVSSRLGRDDLTMKVWKIAKSPERGLKF
jgi:hypothetical protein